MNADSVLWGEDAVQEIRSWNTFKRNWAKIRVGFLYNYTIPVFGSKSVRTMLLALACNRGEELGMPSEREKPFNEAAYHLHNIIFTTSTEYEMLYKEGVGLAYEDISKVHRKFPQRRLAIVIRRMAAHPTIAKDTFHELKQNLFKDERKVAEWFAERLPRTWHNSGGSFMESLDSRDLVAAAYRMLNFSPAEMEIFQILHNDREAISRNYWEDVRKDIEGATNIMA